MYQDLDRDIQNNPYEICRTCLKNQETLTYIFDHINDENSVSFAEVLKVLKEDSLPQKLCDGCIQRLIISYEFRKQCEKSDTALRERFCAESIALKQKSLPIENSLEVKTIGESINGTDSCDTIVKLDLYKINTNTEPKHSICKNCGKNIKSKFKLERHLISHNNLNKYFCNSCDNNIPKSSLLAEYPLVHKSLQCTKCLRQFKKEKHLLKHLKILPECCEVSNRRIEKHHRKVDTHKLRTRPIRCYSCELCKQSFKLKNALKKHILEHSLEDGFSSQDEKSYTCFLCARTFRHLNSFNIHRRTHTGEAPFLCSECGKCFTTECNLKQHIVRHSGLKPFACHLCPTKFNNKGTLTCHIRTHLGVQSYICDTCGHSFTHSSALKKHKRTHLGLRPWGCDSCTKRFSSKEHLKRHLLIHTGEKPYKCQYCDKAFNQTFNLAVHTRSHVGDNLYQCTVCSERFRLLSELKKHYPTHYTLSEKKDEEATNLKYITESLYIS